MKEIVKIFNKDIIFSRFFFFISIQKLQTTNYSFPLGLKVFFLSSYLIMIDYFNRSIMILTSEFSILSQFLVFLVLFFLSIKTYSPYIQLLFLCNIYLQLYEICSLDDYLKITFALFINN